MTRQRTAASSRLLVTPLALLLGCGGKVSTAFVPATDVTPLSVAQTWRGKRKPHPHRTR
jgi:hypothetical protein